MSKKSNHPNLQDFNVVRSWTKRKQKDNDLADLSSGFYFLVMDLWLPLQDDEILDSITDSNFLKLSGKTSGHDRGIDSFFIDHTDSTPKIHIFNFKYTNEFKTAQNNNFPAGEINNIINIVDSIMLQDEILLEEVNPVLASKIKEVWNIFAAGHNPEFKLHICSNYWNGIEKMERQRLERSINKCVDIEYHLMPDIVQRLTSQGKKVVNAKITAISKGFFEKSDGNIRALIAIFDARDLIRVVIDDDEIRAKVDMDNSEYESLKNMPILKDAFEDNVRLKLENSYINRNIKNTALSNENNKFFYYNNGITMTCKSFEYADRNNPVIELTGLQIVNGAQTIYSLYGALQENPEKIGDIEILCRICETQNSELSTRIAEYTNSQNPVKSRDIRSVDYIQKKLEKELESMQILYERKKNQHKDKPNSKKLDAEKIGQILMAFYNKSPYEAKNRKGSIFGDRYEEVFNENINANGVLLAHGLYERIELEKNRKRFQIVQDARIFEEKSYITHATYYILYVIGELSRYVRIDLSHENIDSIWALYPKSLKIIEAAIKEERNKSGDQYEHSTFFRSNKVKKYFEDLSEKEIDKLIG